MAATVAAVTLPTLVVHWVVVGYAIFAQLVATVLWGLAIAAWAWCDRTTRVPWRRLMPLLVALGLIAAGAAATWWRVGGVVGPILCTIALLAASAAVAATAARLTQGSASTTASSAVPLAFVVTAMLGTLIVGVQTMAPQWTGNLLVASIYALGRPGANMLQPNHLATFLAWGIAACMLLHMAGRLGIASVAVLVAAFSWAIGMTGSRAGLAQLLLIVIWSVMDRNLRGGVRACAIVALVVCGITTLLSLSGLASPEVADARSYGRSTGTRMAMVMSSLNLIADHPWTGIGWNEVGGAWALSNSVVQTRVGIDHVHNLPLNLAVELGVPLSAAILFALGWSAWRAAREAREPTSRFVLLMIALVAVHSVVEFPLWFAYFLLPTAWLFGEALGRQEGAGSASTGAELAGVKWQPWSVVGVAVSMVSLIGLADFVRALPAALPSMVTEPVAERVARGRQSVLFRQFADQSAVIAGVDRSLSAIRSARYVLADVALLETWSRALARAGNVEEARYLSRRVRGFLLALGSRRVIPCDDQVGLEVGLPCGDPERPVDWTSIR